MVETCFVRNSYAPTTWWTGFVTLGINGVEAIHPMPELSGPEKAAVIDVIPVLEKELARGEEAANR